jgi:hypothetical protein
MDEEVREWVKKKMEEIDALKNDLKALEEMKEQTLPKAPLEKIPETEAMAKPIEEQLPLTVEEEAITAQPIEQTPDFEMPAIQQTPAQAEQPILSAQPLEMPAAEKPKEQLPQTLSITESQFSKMERQYGPKPPLLSQKSKVLLAINIALIAVALFFYFYILPMISSMV